jgi:hypothetical protein
MHQGKTREMRNILIFRKGTMHVMSAGLLSQPQGWKSAGAKRNISDVANGSQRRSGGQQNQESPRCYSAATENTSNYVRSMKRSYFMRTTAMLSSFLLTVTPTSSPCLITSISTEALPTCRFRMRTSLRNSGNRGRTKTICFLMPST